MKKYFIFLFTLFTSLCISQTTKEEFIQLGLKQYNNKNYDIVIALYEKALTLDDSYYTAYINRGNAYLEKQDYNKALADANKALLNSTNAVPYNNRGLVYKF